MKRHLNSLLQRKHTEFEGAHDTGRLPRFSAADEVVAVQLKDGYDWLAMIKDVQATLALAQG